MTMMSNEEEKRCPLCAEEMDWTDQQFKPCKCGYQVCVWCWHHIMEIAEKDVSEGRCPACRTKYEKDKVVAMQANFERAGNNNSNRKSKPPKAKPKANEVRKDLTNVRVIQRKMAYVTGLPLSLADEDLLQRKEYFGQYGKISKISLSRTAGGSIQLFNDTCSVYITYSKEEEAVQCIQSVHGFVLEGLYLRASFGTAKYCHAWLRNTPCGNPSCLYLHSLGADEDSFGKDEAAASHTRSRVQQIVGATSSAMKRSGDVLPPPIDELSNTSFTSTDNSTIRSAGEANDIVKNSNCMVRVVPSSDKDGGAGEQNRMTTFVDVVGLSNSSGDENDGNSSEDSRILDLCSNLSSIETKKDNHAQETYSDKTLSEVPSSSHLVNHLTRDQNSMEVSDEPFREDSISFNGQRSKDSNGICRREFFMSSQSTKYTGDSCGNTLMHRRTCSVSNSAMEHRSLHNQVEEATPPLSYINSAVNDGYHDLKFQNSVKSDTIYRGSNSFSNEEIVEHLRRTKNDNLNNYDERPAFSSVNFGPCDDSLTMRHSLTGLSNESNGQHGSSWNSLHSGQPGFSFVKQDGFPGQRADLDSSSNISMISTKSSILHDFRENKEQYMHESQYQIARSKGVAPPGFSIPSRDLPPGFPLSGEIVGFPRTLSGSQLVNSSSNLIHPLSTRSTSTAGDADFFDPAMSSCGKGKATNGFSIAGLEVGSQSRVLEDEGRHWLLMQQKYADQQGKFSSVLASQTPSVYQEQRFLSADEYAGPNNLYGFSSRLVDQRQSVDQSLYTQFPQQKLVNGHISNGYQHSVLDDFQCRKEVGGVSELQRNERLGFNRYYTGSGYGNLTFQGSRSDDVFARVFGM